MKCGIYSTKVMDNKGRVWDLGKGEHVPEEENVWVVNAWTEMIAPLDIKAAVLKAECLKEQPTMSPKPVANRARLAA